MFRFTIQKPATRAKFQKFPLTSSFSLNTRVIDSAVRLSWPTSQLIDAASCKYVAGVAIPRRRGYKRQATSFPGLSLTRDGASLRAGSLLWVGYCGMARAAQSGAAAIVRFFSTASPTLNLRLRRPCPRYPTQTSGTAPAPCTTTPSPFFRSYVFFSHCTPTECLDEAREVSSRGKFGDMNCFTVAGLMISRSSYTRVRMTTRSTRTSEIRARWMLSS